MTRHRPRLLKSRNPEFLRDCLRGKCWGEFLQIPDHEIDGVLFRTRMGYHLGQPRIAIMASGQFLAIKALPDKPEQNLIFGYGYAVLRPKGPYYGYTIPLYYPWSDGLFDLRDLLVIEEEKS